MDPWTIRKRQFITRLEEDLKRGRVDEDVLSLLNAINSTECYYTTSSCSGRIQLAEAEWPGDKFNMKVVAKWHRTVKEGEVKRLLRGDYKYLWLLVQPPIVHVVSADLTKADRLVKLARYAGFKHSGVQSFRENRIVVEIMGSERMEMPLIIRGKLVIKEEELNEIVERANFILNRGKEKLKKLQLLVERCKEHLCKGEVPLHNNFYEIL